MGLCWHKYILDEKLVEPIIYGLYGRELFLVCDKCGKTKSIILKNSQVLIPSDKSYSQVLIPSDKSYLKAVNLLSSLIDDQ